MSSSCLSARSRRLVRLALHRSLHSVGASTGSKPISTIIEPFAHSSASKAVAQFSSLILPRSHLSLAFRDGSAKFIYLPNRHFSTAHRHLTGSFPQLSRELSRSVHSSSQSVSQPARNGHMAAAAAASQIPSAETSLSRLHSQLCQSPRVIYLGHCSALLSALAMFMHDMLALRFLMMCASAAGIAFNALHPTPAKVPIVWGCILVLLNLFQIAILLDARQPVTFSPDESDVYSRLFAPHGMRHKQFQRLLREAGGELQELPAGYEMVREGQQVDSVSVIISGRAVVSHRGETVGELSLGSMVGETALLEAAHVASHEVVTSEPCRVVTWQRDRLSRLVSSDPSLLLCTSRAISCDLASKLSKTAAGQSHAAVLETYLEVLRGMTSHGVLHPAEKRALREFRTRHAVSLAQHAEALRQCGWREEEYEDGAKAEKLLESPLSKSPSSTSLAPSSSSMPSSLSSMPSASSSPLSSSTASSPSPSSPSSVLKSRHWGVLAAEETNPTKRDHGLEHRRMEVQDERREGSCS